MLDTLSRRSTISAGRFGNRGDYVMRSQDNQSLSLEEMRRRLPAIFAPHAHESRSDRYVYISTEDMVNALMERGFVPVEARMGRSRIEDKQNYTKHMLRFRQESDLKNLDARRVGDTSYEVILRNAHDGTSAYRFMAGLLRLACLNGLVVSEGTASDVHVLHKGNRQEQLSHVIEGAFTVLEHGPTVMETVRDWQAMPLSRDEQQVMAEAAHTLRFADAEGNVETPIKPEQLLIPRRPSDHGSSLWQTFNVVQENVIRGGLTAFGRDKANRLRKTTTREVKGIDGDIKLNRALWTVAQKMAELKQAA